MIKIQQMQFHVRNIWNLKLPQSILVWFKHGQKILDLFPSLINSSEANYGKKNMQVSAQMARSMPCCQFVFVLRQTTLLSMNTDTTCFNSSLCSPSYPLRMWNDTHMGGKCSLSLDCIQINLIFDLMKTNFAMKILNMH